MTRRIPAGDGVYNLAVTRDGKLLIATNKRGQSVSVIDIGQRQGARAHPDATTRRARRRHLATTIATRSSPSRAMGSEPGTVEMIDLRDARSASPSVDVGQMAGGIDFWRSLPANREP